MFLQFKILFSWKCTKTQRKEKGTIHFLASLESLSTLLPSLLLICIIFSFSVYKSYWHYWEACLCKERGQPNLKRVLTLTAKSLDPGNSTFMSTCSNTFDCLMILYSILKTSICLSSSCNVQTDLLHISDNRLYTAEINKNWCRVQ